MYICVYVFIYSKYQYRCIYVYIILFDLIVEVVYLIIGNLICFIKNSHNKEGDFSSKTLDDIQVGSGLTPLVLSIQSTQQLSSLLSILIIDAFNIQLGISSLKFPILLNSLLELNPSSFDSEFEISFLFESSLIFFLTICSKI